MKKSIYLIFAILVILSHGCSASGEIHLPTETLAPNLTRFAETTPVLSSTPTAIKPYSVTATQTPTEIITSTPAIPLDARLEIQCLQDELVSSNISSYGTVILERYIHPNNGQREPGDFLLDMATKQITKPPLPGYNYVISPDRKFMAYRSPTFNKEGREVKADLIVAKASGEPQIIIPAENGWGFSPAWSDDQNLLINLAELDPYENRSEAPATMLVLNPFNGERTILSPDFPDYLAAPATIVPWWDGWSGVIYDPTLTRAIYPFTISNPISSTEEMYTYALWDLEQQVLVKSYENVFAAFALFNDSYPQPQWTSDGSYFAFVGMVEIADLIQWELYRVSRDGEVEQLTNLTSIALMQTSNFSWSPDGRFIAMFLNNWGEGIYTSKAHLAVLDTKTLFIKDYCIQLISGDGELIGGEPPRPIWSPDSKQFLVVDRYQEADQHVILIDIEKGLALQIAEGMEPVGWMDEPER